ncbi:hypothetical protein L1987_77698 [Smallanthus sonchifolius]|uniref:Uncharacterized protein n=1 Tax=Smallanthus sonchifolius TaxID=185202 RepID=A0ACB8ZBL9_9ASTR|nr:hypothetical protein L1987_77698 [Smallanthus sonchifolius]
MPDHHHHHHRHVTGNPPPKPSPKLLYIFLKFIVMSLILSLFLLFIGLAAIILIHLLFAGSFLHRHRRRRRLLSRPTTLSLQDIHNHLPPFQYPAKPASDDCSICLELFNQGEICRVLPVCDHVFHARCVDKWLMKVPNCPICRTRVRLDAGGVSDLVDGDDENKFLWAIGVGS